MSLPQAWRKPNPPCPPYQGGKICPVPYQGGEDTCPNPSASRGELGVKRLGSISWMLKRAFHSSICAVFCAISGVELFGDAIQGDAIVGGEDEFLFEPKGLLEVFDVGEKVYELGGNFVDELCGFEPIVTVG